VILYSTIQVWGKGKVSLSLYVIKHHAIQFMGMQKFNAIVFTSAVTGGIVGLDKLKKNITS
jgi:hypothetical protein